MADQLYLKMRYTTFRYNAETCQYERVRLNAKSVLCYILGLAAMGCCMLIGILLLHDFVINTDRENRLRRENVAFRKHHQILTAKLNELQPVLTSLQNKDRVLHEKFFGSQPVSHPANLERASKQNLLLADGQSFRDQVTALKDISEKLIATSAMSNIFFGGKLSIKKDALPGINALPTLPPVQPCDTERLISGFGMRVNPFHKGLYEHLGVDLAMPRGTPVVAAADGKITQLKRSELQAGYGNYIEIDHGNGMVTRYAHLEDIDVKFGTKIGKGERIGTIGTSGGSIAPHLHYEILRDGKNVDPVFYMLEGLPPSEHYILTLVSHRQNQSLD